MRWLLFRLREGARWLFRGQDFHRVEDEIERLAAPLAAQALTLKKAAKIRKRIKHALSYLPADRAEKLHDMMDRVGHSVRS